MKQTILLLTLVMALACNSRNKQASDALNVGESEQGGELITNTLPSKDVLLGKFEPSADTNFVVIPDHMTTHKSIYCHREAFGAYLAMRDSAQTDGIDLIIVSATRNFEKQKQIWERKWNNQQTTVNRQRSTVNGQQSTVNGQQTTDTTLDISKIRWIMQYSSMPGTSRHHWGTELDFISTEPEYWAEGEGLRIYKWLCENAPKFGFYQPYTAEATRTGYAEERWHWSYRPISEKYLEAYTRQIKAEDITGFSGSYLVDSLGIIQSHVLGVAR